MRKGGLVRLSNYFGPGGPPPTLVLGLFWDVTGGVNIDLDARGNDRFGVFKVKGLY